MVRDVGNASGAKLNQQMAIILLLLSLSLIILLITSLDLGLAYPILSRVTHVRHARKLHNQVARELLSRAKFHLFCYQKQT